MKKGKVVMNISLDEVEVNSEKAINNEKQTND